MAVRAAAARWEGNLKEGGGQVKTESKALDKQYSFSSRFEEGTGTNPEELMAASHASCYSMALSLAIAEAGYAPEYVQTNARVHLGKDDVGFAIKKIELQVEASVPDLADDEFQELAEGAKTGCPISKALASVESIELEATLV